MCFIVCSNPMFPVKDQRNIQKGIPFGSKQNIRLDLSVGPDPENIISLLSGRFIVVMMQQEDIIFVGQIKTIVMKDMTDPMLFCMKGTTFWKNLSKKEWHQANPGIVVHSLPPVITDKAIEWEDPDIWKEGNYSEKMYKIFPLGEVPEIEGLKGKLESVAKWRKP